MDLAERNSMKLTEQIKLITTKLNLTGAKYEVRYDKELRYLSGVGMTIYDAVIELVGCDMLDVALSFNKLAIDRADIYNVWMIGDSVEGVYWEWITEQMIGIILE